MTSLSRALIALTAAALSAACQAAVSPLADARDYAFTRPVTTNAIKGTVLGDAGTRGALRYEDVAFIHEAVSERDYLTRTSVSTNDVNDIATNAPKTLASPLIRTLALKPHLDRFLDPSCNVSSQPRVVSTTNVYTRPFESWSMPTNIYPAVTNYITQTMTNGTVNVWTNVVQPFATNVLQRTTVSNVLASADYCMVENVITLKDSARTKWRSLPLGETLSLDGPYALRGMTNLYALVRSMRRKVPSVYLFDNLSTNNTLKIYVMQHSNAELSSYTTTNVTTGATYEGYVRRYYDYRDEQEKDGDEWVSTDGFPFEDEAHDRHVFSPDPIRIKIKTGLCDELITGLSSGGSFSRIQKADAFALVSCRYTKSQNEAHTSNGSGSSSNSSLESTNVFGQVMTPLGSLTRNVGERFLTFETYISPDIFENAANALDLPFVDLAYETDLPPAGQMEWIYDDEDDPRERERSIYRSSTEKIEADLEIYLVLHLNPTTKLSTWSEYD